MQNSTAFFADGESTMPQPQVLSEKQNRYKENRRKLIALSVKARTIRSEEALDGNTINVILKDFFYDTERMLTFNTFHEWQNLGYRVKKGEKAFLFWGRKQKVSQDATAESEEEKRYSFFPICYLFSSQQVEKTAKK